MSVKTNQLTPNAMSNHDNLEYIEEEEEVETTAEAPAEAEVDTSQDSSESSYMPPSEEYADDMPPYEGDEVEAEAETEEVEGASEALDEAQSEESTDTITLDGQEYSTSDLLDALKAKSNMEDWQRSNTQKAQEVAEQRRQLEELQSQLSAIQEGQAKSAAEADLSPEEQQTRKWLEQNGYVHKDAVEQMIEERLSPFQQQAETLAQAQASQQLLKEIGDLQDHRGLSEDEAYKVAEFADANRYYDMPLDDVYILMNKDNILKQTAEAAREQAAKTQAQKEQASRVLSTKGARQGSQPRGYNPNSDRGKSWSDMAQDAISEYGL